jgi:carbon monoxide dehydrogenase subunit G
VTVVAGERRFAASRERVYELLTSPEVIAFDLEREGDATLMRWRTELRLAGVLGKLAGPGGEAVARRQADRTLDEVTRRL